MLEWGAKWLDKQARDHTSQKVSVQWGNVIVQLDASLVDEVGRVLPSTQNIKTEFTRFLFHSSDITLNNIVLKPGLFIFKGDEKFEVVVNGNKCWAYNDSYNKTIVVETKRCTVPS